MQQAGIHEQVETFTPAKLAGKYLTFQLDREFYGLEILKVQEIIGVMKTTTIPKSPDYVRGMTNLRGRVVPVIDLRARFGLAETTETEKTVIIVVQVEHSDLIMTIGLLVDQVSEVLNIFEHDIEPAPRLNELPKAGFIKALGKVGRVVIKLLDADGIFSGDELYETAPVV